MVRQCDLGLSEKFLALVAEVKMVAAEAPLQPELGTQQVRCFIVAATTDAAVVVAVTATAATGGRGRGGGCEASQRLVEELAALGPQRGVVVVPTLL